MNDINRQWQTELTIGVEVVHILGSGLMFTIVKYYRLGILHVYFIVYKL